MLKFRASYLFDRIDSIEVERETTVNIYINKDGKQHRIAKVSGYYQIFDSKKEAKENLLKSIELKLQKAHEDIERLTKKFNFIQSL